MMLKQHRLCKHISGSSAGLIGFAGRVFDNQRTHIGMSLLYETIGRSYSETRKPDPRITNTLAELLDLPAGKSIADIGAGTGSYSLELQKRGFAVTAIEPSSVMRSQAAPDTGIQWIDAAAEALPLEDTSVDGAVITLAYHHFSNPRKALEEAARVAGWGPIVLFTMSPERLPEFWLCKYFPYFLEEARAAFPPVEILTGDIRKWLGRRVETVQFPLPQDLSDGFAAAGWAHPARYLDPRVRNGISSFARMPEADLNLGLQNLDADLLSGQWDVLYGSILEQETYDAGYIFVKVHPSA